MGEVTVSIGGRSYSLACRDGDEAHLTALAGMVESKTGGLTMALGVMSEPRLLLMAGLLVADELHEARKPRATPLSAAAPAIDDDRLTALAAQLEALADSLDHDSAELLSIDKAAPACLKRP